MKMNLANKLTIFRILLVPVIMLIPIIDNLVGIPGEFLEISTAFWIMNIIFIVASITDKLDGYIARSRNQVTTFGKFLDPLADKILVLSALVILVEYGKIPSWIPIIVLARELTKIHEEFIRKSIDELLSEIDTIKGEMILIIEGNKIDTEECKNFDEISLEDHYKLYEEKGLNKKEIIKQIAKDRNVNKNEIYMYFLEK